MGVSNPDIPGYEDFSEIGRGAQAVVYRATNRRLSRPEALKVFLESAAPDAALRQFEREQQAMVKFGDHPSIVQIFDVGVTSAGTPYLAMEYCPRGSLAERLETDGPFPTHEVIEIGHAIASALSAAHSHGVLHRDVKPENILSTQYGAKLADFGISRAAHLGRTTLSGAVTPLHAAPELFGDDGDPTPASDLWSLGSTLYTLLAGRAPFAAKNGSYLGLLKRITSEDPPPFDAVLGIPVALEVLIRQTLSRDPTGRPSTAIALARTLEQIQRDPSASAVAPLPPRSTQPTTTSQHPPDLAATVDPSRRNNPSDGLIAPRRSRPIPSVPSAPKKAPVYGRLNARFPVSKPIPAESKLEEPVAVAPTERPAPTRLKRARRSAVSVTLDAERKRTDHGRAAISADAGSAVSMLVRDSRIAARPHMVAETEAVIRNAGSMVDEFRVEVRGIPASWVTTEPSSPTRLYPGTGATIRIAIHPLDEAFGTPGILPLEISARSLRNPSVRCAKRVDLAVEGASDVTTWIEPPFQAARRSAAFTLLARNNGPVELDLRLEPCVGNDGLLVSCTPDALRVPPGLTARATVTATISRRRRRPRTDEELRIEITGGRAPVVASTTFRAVVRGDTGGGAQKEQPT